MGVLLPENKPTATLLLAGEPNRWRDIKGGSEMSNNKKFAWLDEPEDLDYQAAYSYLSLIYDESTVSGTVEELKKAPISEFKAKDIFRASGLSLLGVSNSHVEKDRQKITKGYKLQ
jgi:hypothetical protein